MSPVLGSIRKLPHPLGIAITRPETIERLAMEQRELARIKCFHGFLGALTPLCNGRGAQALPRIEGGEFSGYFRYADA